MWLVICLFGFFNLGLPSLLANKPLQIPHKASYSEAKIREKLFDRRFDDDYRYAAGKYPPATNDSLPWQSPKSLTGSTGNELFKDDFDDERGLDSDYFDDPFEEDRFDTFN